MKERAESLKVLHKDWALSQRSPQQFFQEAATLNLGEVAATDSEKTTCATPQPWAYSHFFENRCRTKNKRQGPATRLKDSIVHLNNVFVIGKKIFGS